MGIYKGQVSYKNQEGFEKQEDYTSLYYRVKSTILNKRDNLTTAFNIYYKVVKLRKKNSAKKRDDLVSALIDMYLEVKHKLYDEIVIEKEIKDRMEKIITENDGIEFHNLYWITDKLLDWLEESGLTRIAIDKTDWEEELKREEAMLDD